MPPRNLPLILNLILEQLWILLWHNSFEKVNTRGIVQLMMLLDEHAARMAYRIGRGEQGVLTFEPYKSAILPQWRFRTPEIARESSQVLWARFQEFGEEGDFIGMDMTRKFIQMVC